VDSIYDIVWARDPETGASVTYGDVRFEEELQFSVYNFEFADVTKLWEHFNLYEAEGKALLDRANALFASDAEVMEKRRFPLLATYELALKCSNLFNLLDARGAVSVTERVGVIGRIRNLAVGVAKAYALQQASQQVSELASQRKDI
jgi:glycyl-tRNA synthetase alpha chain